MSCRVCTHRAIITYRSHSLVAIAFPGHFDFLWSIATVLLRFVSEIGTMKLLFDPVQLEKESRMAKKRAANGGLNVSEEIREALGKLGKDASHTEVGEFLTKKHPSDAQIAKAVAAQHWYQNVYTQKKKLTRGKKVANRKLMRAAIRSGSESSGVSLEAAMMFALKAGGIDAAKKALDDLAEKLKG